MARGGADIGGLIKIAAVGVGGYYLYDWWTKRAPSATTPATTTPAANTGAMSLVSIFGRVQAAVGSTPYTADQFNYYLQQQLPVGKSAPDPATFLGSTPRESTMSLVQYWAAVEPKLKSDLGLSGVRGLGDLYNAYRGLPRPSLYGAGI